MCLLMLLVLWFIAVQNGVRSLTPHFWAKLAIKMIRGLISECTPDTFKVIIIIITIAQAGIDSSNLPNNSRVKCHILKQNEPERARAESTHKGVNQGWTNVTRTQQRPESTTVTLTMRVNAGYVNSTRGTPSTRFQARSKDQEILEEGGGAGPSS